MTTSHRPQLEARSGAKAASYVPTSTQHARLLPGHKKLKYRKSKNVPGPLEEDQEKGEADEKEGDKEDEKEDEEESDDAGDDEEEEDDQEALLQELNNIRQERMVKKVRDEQQQEQRNTTDLTRIPAKTSTSGWRKTTFGRNKVSKNKSDVTAPGYVNDMTKTAYHEEFIRRFTK